MPRGVPSSSSSEHHAAGAVTLGSPISDLCRGSLKTRTIPCLGERRGLGGRGELSLLCPDGMWSHGMG